MDTIYACKYYSGGTIQVDRKSVGSGSLYEGVSYGVAASVLSLCTNLYVTTVVALKAWYVFEPG